jgi:hypothetical protein
VTIYWLFACNVYSNLYSLCLWIFIHIASPSFRHLRHFLIRNKLRILLKVLFVDFISSSFGTSVLQQLILLQTSFLLGCGFPPFLIGFYSIRIWESRLRFYRCPLWVLDPPAPAVRNLDQNTRRITRTEIGIVVERRGIDHFSLFFLCEEDRDQVYPGTFIYFGRCSVPQWADH